MDLPSYGRQSLYYPQVDLHPIKSLVTDAVNVYQTILFVLLIIVVVNCIPVRYPLYVQHQVRRRDSHNIFMVRPMELRRWNVPG